MKLTKIILTGIFITTTFSCQLDKPIINAPLAIENNPMVKGKHIPLWSPDGNKILYIEQNSEKSAEVYVSDQNGKNVKKIYSNFNLIRNNHGDYNTIKWLPDSKTIGFNQSDSLYTINSETLELKKIIEMDRLRDFTWNQTMDKFITVSFNESLNDTFTNTPDILYLIDAKSLKKTKLGENLIFFKPEFIPENKITFRAWGYSPEDIKYETYMINENGDNLVKLYNFSASDWSKDREKILFSDNAGINIFNTNSSEIIKLKESQERVEGTEPNPKRVILYSSPKWSSDGKKILFIAYESVYKTLFRETITEKTELRIINEDGTNEKLLVDNFDSYSVSPDGKRILFTSISNGKSVISIVNEDGSEKRILFN